MARLDIDKLPRIVCTDCLREVSVMHSDWRADLETDTRGYAQVECHERRIVRFDLEQLYALRDSGRPLLWGDLRFVTFDEAEVEKWEKEATELMERVRIVTEHFKAGGK